MLAVGAEGGCLDISFPSFSSLHFSFSGRQLDVH